MPATAPSKPPLPRSAAAPPRAAILAAPATIRVAPATLPVPAAGQVRVRLEGCGVCASNVPVWEGRPWFQYPLEPGAPGHEGWGRIDAVGAGVTDLQEGDRVACLSYHAFAEYDIAEAAATIRLPDALRGVPVLGEPLGCAWNIFKRSEIRAGQTVAIIGIGFLGALLTQLADHAGAEVLAISRRPWALEIARRCGAAHVLELGDVRETAERVKALIGESGCPRVIEATGKQSGLDLAGELTAVRGRLIVAGYHQDGRRQVDMQLWNWRGIDVINAHERDPLQYVRGMQAAVEAIQGGQLNPLPLLTHEFPLERLSEALEMASQRPPGFLKAYLRFQ